MARAPITDEELEQWAKMRADDAGHLARELIAYRRADTSPPSSQMTVASIVPPHCSGYSFVFEPGVLHVKKDGSGYIAVNEDDFVLEDDRCEGPDGPEGSVHWIARMDASELIALRDFLNGKTAQHATVADYATRLFDLHGFMLLETYRDKPAVTVTFPNLKQAQQFHDALVELSTHRPRQPAASEGSDNG